MSNTLFPPHTYSLPLPAPFNIAGINKNRSDVKSRHRPALANITLHAPTLRAALEIIYAQKGLNKAAIGRQGDFVLVERENSKGAIEVVAYDTKKGTFKAGIFGDSGSTPDAYSIGKSKRVGSTLLMAAIFFGERIARDPELKDCMDMLSEYEYDLSSNDEDALSKCGAILCDNIYTRILSADSLGSDGIKAVVPSTSNIQMLNRLAIDRGSYNPEEIYAGEFRVLPSDGAKKLGYKPISNSDLPGKFVFSERSYLPFEQELIPDIEPWYIVPKEVVRICQHAQATTEASQPMRNFMLRGPAGVGKTEAAKAIAAALNLPYLSLTCSANTEIFDLLGQILPDVEGIETNSEDGTNTVSMTAAVMLPKLPTLEDIQMDTATAYEMLTGVYNENITMDEVYAKLLEVVKKSAANEMSENIGKAAVTTGQKFRYVETPLVKAMKYGYLIEIQEPSVIANPGVLVGLNSLLDNCKQITLPTGETIKRHPDTVVIVSTNNDYAGCRDMNQSIISRMNLVMDIDEPTNKELISRVSAITGCEDDEALSLMATVVKDIQTHCRESMITDGSCGMRELISWAQSYMIVKDLAESAQYTVLSSVSAVPENREFIMNTCFAPMVAA